VKPPSKTRITGYAFTFDFDEPAMERLLAKAKERGTVTQYDTGRGHAVWFEGAPGRELREVRRQVERMRGGA
jgi:hypothetical protein